MRRERADHTLQPTALINEAFIRLSRNVLELDSRAEFIASAANVMRHILVDHARSHLAGMRGGGQPKVPLDDVKTFSWQDPKEVLALNEALERLEQLSARQAKIVELRFFGGLSEIEISDLLGISGRSVKRDWATARLWLYKQMSTSE